MARMIDKSNNALPRCYSDDSDTHNNYIGYYTDNCINMMRIVVCSLYWYEIMQKQTIGQTMLAYVSVGQCPIGWGDFTAQIFWIQVPISTATASAEHCHHTALSTLNYWVVYSLDCWCCTFRKYIVPSHCTYAIYGWANSSRYQLNWGMTIEWVAAKHCGRALRIRISDTHQLGYNLHIRSVI